MKKNPIFTILLVTLIMVSLLFTSCNDLGTGAATTTESGVTPPVESLEYELSDFEDGYAVVGIGNVSATEIAVPSEYEGKPVTSIGDSAFENNETLVSITLPDTLLQIGSYAFSGCTSLKAIVIPDSVETVGEGVFVGCTSLAEVTLSGGMSTVGAFMFNDCTALRSIIIPDNIYVIGERAFMNCTSLATVDMSENVMRISGYSFANCASLEEIDLPEYLTGIGYGAFERCSSLVEVKFAAPDAWRCFDDRSESFDIAEEIFSDPAQAADYLVNVYPWNYAREAE